MNENERIVYDYINGVGMYFTDVALGTELSYEQVAFAISTLFIKGYVEYHPGVTPSAASVWKAR